ncbi:uracil-DNA glycosylase [bacterium]|nr:uracil-DNA glycosylase [bacterium]
MSMNRQSLQEELLGVVKLTKQYISKQGVGIKSDVEKKDGKTLLQLKGKINDCQKCPLAKTRTHLVFGAGDEHAKLMFVGEAPGRDEDLQGEPFVGKAGQLLTKIINSIGLKRKDVYIANILKCRPPGNRNPEPYEIAMCQGYLLEQISIIKPKIICALGKFAAQTLLNNQQPISQLRGKFFEYMGAKLIPTFHPAYLLYNPNDKKLVWQDMKKIKVEYEKNVAISDR